MRLYESLYIFSRYKQDINYLIEFMIDFGYRERKQNEWNLKDQALYVALYNTILMNTCSYLDEYKAFLTRAEPEFHQRIITIRKIAKPALKKLNEWTDLQEYRNQMVAHNFRIDGDRFSFNMLGQYNAPRTYLDIVMLRKHLMMIQGVIEAEFYDVLPNINTFIQSFEVKEQKIDYTTVEEDLLFVLNEINRLCVENGKFYGLDIDVFIRL